MSQDRYEALDSLRGLAATAVVFDHILDLCPQFGGYVVQAAPARDPFVAWLAASPVSLLWKGQSAVALFFVLSGFVLSLPWFRGRPPSYRVFVVRRMCRIYLPYVIAIGCAIVLATLFRSAHPPAISKWFADANWSEPIGPAIIWDHVFMLGMHNTLDNPIWSLNHEMRISLVFPAIVLIIARFGPIGAVILAAFLYGAAGAIAHYSGWADTWVEFAATVRFGAFFVLGSVLARYADWLSALRYRWTGPVGCAAVIAGLAFNWAWQEPALIAAGSGLIILGAVLPGPVRNGLRSRGLVWLGKISFSLYLTHLVIIVTAIYALSGLLPLGAVVGVALVAIGPVAWLFHRWVEAPSNRLGRRVAPTAIVPVAAT